MLVNVERMKKKLQDEGLDAVVATALENVHYLSGVYSSTMQMFPMDGQCYAIVTQDRPDEPFVVSSTLDVDQVVMDGFDTVRDIVTFGTFYRLPPVANVTITDEERELQKRSDLDAAYPSPVAALAAALTKLGLQAGKVGIDESTFKPEAFEVLQQELPDITLVKARETLRWVRRVKTDEEIRRLRAAAQITQNAILATAAIARVGVTEYELSREFERSIVSQGGTPKFTLIRIGRNAVAGQVLPTRTALKKGDVIWFDVGCIHKGYWSDIARNVALGEPPERYRTVYNAMQLGEEHAINEVRAGMTGADVFNLTMEASKAAGAPQYKRHHVGHGIGAEVYEQPILAPGNSEVIEEGSVVNIETPYYEYGLGALHVEDPFVVRASGNEVLTSLTRDLILV